RVNKSQSEEGGRPGQAPTAGFPWLAFEETTQRADLDSAQTERLRVCPSFRRSAVQDSAESARHRGRTESGTVDYCRRRIDRRPHMRRPPNVCVVAVS